jgi:hypothetical protein
MVDKIDDTGPEVEVPAWVGITKFILLVGMVALFFLLGQSMVHSHFVDGEVGGHEATVQQE